MSLISGRCLLGRTSVPVHNLSAGTHVDYQNRDSCEFSASKRPPNRRQASSRFLEREEMPARGMNNVNLAVPRRGHVLSTVAEVYGKPIREAVALLFHSLRSTDALEYRRAFIGRIEQSSILRSDAELAAWSVVAIWITAISVNELPTSASLSEAERWFFGSARLTRLLSAEILVKAEDALRLKAEPSAYLQLLPYLLDPHGPGSRTSVRRDATTHSARRRKRAEGVFYTPADVADYMADSCLDEIDGANWPTIFDPACGTGVFLRSALRNLRRRYADVDAVSLASHCLFGADIDPWALSATAFVMLADSWGQTRVQDLPVQIWHGVRENLACIDTLQLDGQAEMAFDVTGDLFQAGDLRFSISTIFPALKSGPNVILGNPPYADLGQRPDHRVLRRVFATLAIRPVTSAEIYLPFIEQMIRLSNRETCAGAFVLPLSIACNVGAPFIAIRELISRTRGRWRFAFFDREPHALFGEDVKTRNTIMFWSRTSSDSKPVLFTGPLRKWRGESRAEMFRTLSFSRIESNIRGGIPKVEGDVQVASLKTLRKAKFHLKDITESISRVILSETTTADDRTVFIGPTAYNFLNVFMNPEQSLPCDGRVISQHPLHAVRCATRTQALAVFAILSSYIAYWWWHVHGDGFHVSAHFVSELPVGGDALSEDLTDALSKVGAELWHLIKLTPLISVNRGRLSLAYSPNDYGAIRRKIDFMLAQNASLEEGFVDELQQFAAHTVAATLRNKPDCGVEGKRI
jgi:hypothetical protein